MACQSVRGFEVVSAGPKWFCLLVEDISRMGVTGLKAGAWMPPIRSHGTFDLGRNRALDEFLMKAT